MNTVGFAYLHIENNRRDEVLDDLSTAGFHSILYDLFSLRSPFRLREHISDEILDAVGILRWLESVISLFERQERLANIDVEHWPNDLFDARELRGNLPAEYQNYTSESAFWIFLLEKSGVLRRMDGLWFLSKAAKKNKSNRQFLLQMLIEGIGYRMNWSVLDGKSAKETGQLAFGASLILLHKYGEQWRDAMFYTNKYFPMFELAREEIQLENHQSEVDFIQVYIYRTFYCFAKMFNFIEIEERESKEGLLTNIRTTAVFQSLFDFRM